VAKFSGTQYEHISSRRILFVFSLWNFADIWRAFIFSDPSLMTEVEGTEEGLVLRLKTVVLVSKVLVSIAPPPTRIGDPALCGSQPLVAPISLCRFRD